MSDIAPDAPAVDAPDTPSPEDAWPEEARAAIAKLREDDKRIRGRYVDLGNLHADDKAAIAGFARALSTGDVDSAAEFLTTNLPTVAGDRLGAYLEQMGFTPRQAAQAQAIATDDDLDEADLEDYVTRIVEKRLADERQTEATRRANDALADTFKEIASALRAIGVDPNSEEGQAIAREGVHFTGEYDSVAEIIKASKEFLDDRAEITKAREAKRRASAPAGTALPQGGAVGETVADDPVSRKRAIIAALSGRQGA